MTTMSRRAFIQTAIALGATACWGQPYTTRSNIPWHERRDVYPEGVASGDPESDSVLLWTRRPPKNGNTVKTLNVEVAEDESFTRVVASAEANVSAETDWTCRVLAANLKPAREYWYRFTDEHGFGSRIGRTITAPRDGDSKPVRFAFVCCQNVQQGASTAYRRMIWEDQRRLQEDRLGFVLHLGDFVYEAVWYPEERPQGMYARKLRDIVRYPNGEKQLSFHIPTTVDDYRALYRAYLLDPDLQDARAHFPFVCMWDNHEFSWKGWQTQQNFGSGVIPAQTRKLAACQAWFEYQPARVIKTNAPGRDRFVPPPVKDSPIRNFDESGLGLEPGNLAVINSLRLYRTFKWGRNVELILTDNRTFRSEPLGDQPGFAPFSQADFPSAAPADVVEILDAGRTFSDGHPPDTIELDGAALPNPHKNAPAQSMLGAEQKAWFLDRLRTSIAPWKLWGNTVAMIDWRTDFHRLPAGVGPKWPTASYALFEDDDWSGYRAERAEILEFVRNRGIAGFATLAGDRHAFTAGVLSTSLPPKRFDPMGVEFITGSISAPGLFEAFEYSLPKDYALRPIFIYQPSSGEPVQNAMNLSLMHGVRSCLTLQKTGDLQQALAESNPEVAPHLSFVDVGGHGYSTVRATSEELEVEFVCIPRPIERNEREDGGPLVYRVTHRVKLWKPDSTPQIERTAQEGKLPLVL
jgi:alkaline phosphatase D